MMKWTSEWPEKKGYYWFYGYRWYGETKKELIFVEVRKTSNGFIYVGAGQFIYKSEVEEPLFQKVILPELPGENDEKISQKTSSG